MRQSALLKSRSGRKSLTRNTKVPAAQTEPIVVEAEDCPVICADEVFLGGADRQGLRVVCFSLPMHHTAGLRRVS
jgi:hypothetical protein